MRRVILDTETTGLSAANRHRITEIGCLEMLDRKVTGKTFHTYLNPGRAMDEGAMRITGLTNEFLMDKPLFSDIVEEFTNFIAGAELIIHNAPFDLSFIHAELSLLKHSWKSVLDYTTILDTLVLARELHPGKKNNLDALCERYSVDRSDRQYHGALLDARILAKLYLAMTTGQGSLHLSDINEEDTFVSKVKISKVKRLSEIDLKIILANADEILEHKKFVNKLKESSDFTCLWSE